MSVTLLQMLNMATKAFIYTIALLFCCALEAQTSVPSVVLHGNCGADLPRFEEWFRDTRLAQGQPYVAAQDRSRKTTTNYPKLKLQMSMSEVEEYLGKPDFAIGMPAARLATAPEPTDHQCSVQTAYIFNKNGENMTDLQDVAIYLFFSRDGKLYWATPQNLPDLKPLGSPNGASLNVQSQILWKEYIFADDGFAITLPSDPHPHKSPQVPNGMAYSVPLSSGGRLSLYMEEANDKCVDTVRGQLGNAKSTAESRGFTVISSREVEGTGYAGVEFVQKVPTGKIDYERWICAAHRLYLFAADWNPDESEPKDLQRIVDSWRVVSHR